MKKLFALLAAVLLCLLPAALAGADVNIPTVPNIQVPTVPSVPNIQVPTVPNIQIPTVPSVPNIQVPSVPNVQVPSVPDIQIPEVQSIPVPEVPDVQLPSAPALAPSNQDAGSGEEPFTFRGGITWGMSQAEVTAAEGEQARSNRNESRIYIYYDPVTVSSVRTAILGYLFSWEKDSLQAAWYALKEASQETYDSLREAYSLKYGEEKEADAEQYGAVYRKVYGIEPMTRAGTLCCWDAPGGTRIWMSMEEDGVMLILYASPELIDDQP